MKLDWRAGALAFVLVAVAACLGLWFTYMEQAVVAIYRPSEAATANPMLAAARLLRQQGRQVDTVATLDILPLDRLPDGIVLLADSAGVTTPAQARLLGAWVQRGNLLVTMPRFASDAELKLINAASKAAPAPQPEAEAEDAAEDEAEAAPEGEDQVALDPLDEADPIGAALGVRLMRGPAWTTRCDPNASKVAVNPKRPSWTYLGCVTLPGAANALEVDTRLNLLMAMPGAVVPAWSDKAETAFRYYRQERGAIVMVASNYFSNIRLDEFDHGELLVRVAALHPKGKITIVQRLGIAPWYETLWRHFAPALLALAALLLASLWMAVRRFGPLLPPQQQERRSLMEHIVASGAWLWQSPAGRDLLLLSVRSRALAVVKRRLPGLAGKSLASQITELAEASGMPVERIEDALDGRAGAHPQQFTRQISTLEELRKTYERH